MFEAEIRPVSSSLRAAGVTRLGIFGSFARGEARPESDVDVLVTFDPSSRTFDCFMSVAETLEDAFQRPVDLVTDASLSPYLKEAILAEVRDVDLGK